GMPSLGVTAFVISSVGEKSVRGILFSQYTHARQNANKFAFALAYSYIGCAEDTPARQCSNKFGIALAYSYLYANKTI
ncbi:MAG: hypothetical protein K2J31_07325, partial [Alistipes sp.]|nr:hypothetical protein [Alistipes sp.]